MKYSYPDDFIWQNCPEEFKKETVVSEDSKKKIIADLKSDDIFLSSLSEKYLDYLKKLPLAFRVVKRDRRFLIKKQDLLLYKISIYLEYHFSGLEWKDTFKRSLCLFAFSGVFYYLIAIGPLKRVFNNIFCMFYNFLFDLYVNSNPQFNAVDLSTTKPSFLYQVIISIKNKIYNFIQLYIGWPHMASWGYTKWLYFFFYLCSFMPLLDRTSTYFHSYFQDDWDNLDNIPFRVSSYCIFSLCGCFYSMFHLANPTDYLVKDLWGDCQRIYRYFFPRKIYFPLSWERWKKASELPRFDHYLLDYFPYSSTMSRRYFKRILAGWYYSPEILATLNSFDVSNHFNNTKNNIKKILIYRDRNLDVDHLKEKILNLKKK